MALAFSPQLLDRILDMASQTLHIDIEAAGPPGTIVVVREQHLPSEYDLRWMDVGLHEASDPSSDYERTRRFKHLGGAIAWARRQLFHGRVFGDSIEMTLIKRSLFDGKPHESEKAVVEITLAGFRAWGRRGYSNDLALDGPRRKCRFDDA